MILAHWKALEWWHLRGRPVFCRICKGFLVVHGSCWGVLALSGAVARLWWGCAAVAGLCAPEPPAGATPLEPKRSTRSGRKTRRAAPPPAPPLEGRAALQTSLHACACRATRPVVMPVRANALVNPGGDTHVMPSGGFLRSALRSSLSALRSRFFALCSPLSVHRLTQYTPMGSFRRAGRCRQW
jgi:hypothetical protein